MNQDLKNKIIGIGISILIIIGIIGFVFKFLLISNESGKKKNNNSLVEDTLPIEMSERAKNLYDLVIGEGIYSSCRVKAQMYKTEGVKLENLLKESAVCYAFLNLDEQYRTPIDYDITGVRDDGIGYCMINLDVVVYDYDASGKCSAYFLDREVFYTASLKVFGDRIISNSSFILDNNVECSVVNGVYYCGEYKGTALDGNKNHYHYVKEYTEDDEEIVIYDYLVYRYDSDGQCYAGFSSNAIGICPSQITNGYIKKYGLLYKHTFKNNGEGDYYWESSTPLNQ